MTALNPAQREAADRIYAAGDALNEAIALAVQTGLEVDVVTRTYTAQPVGQVTEVRARVLSLVPRAG